MRDLINLEQLQVVPSDDPNLQNIPSSCKKTYEKCSASDGYVMLSAITRRNLRLTVHLARDEKGIRGLYLMEKICTTKRPALAQCPYDDCLEFRPDGTHNPKERKDVVSRRYS